MKKIIILSLYILFILSSSSFGNNNIIYNYKLKFLKSSSPPKHITLINIDNVGRNRSIHLKGILFTYSDKKAEKIKIAGNFSSWRLESMQRSKYGVWYYFLSNSKFSETINYKYMIDNLWNTDPENQNKIDDGIGSYLSVLKNQPIKESIQISYKIINQSLIEFRIYNPKAQFISLVGDFNRWNPENDPLKKGSNGIWKIRKNLPKGRYNYQFNIDGNWKADLYNKLSSSNINGSISSIIIIN